LNYAIDREQIVQKALRGHGRRGASAAWPEHWAFDSSALELNYDPSKATALLSEAKIPNREVNADRPVRMSFVCLIPENFALWERLGLHVQRNLAEVGVRMELQKVSVGEFNSRIGSQKFDAALTEFVVGNNTSRPFTFWYSQSKVNVFGYHNPAMDAALEAIRRAENEREYRSAFRRFQLESVGDPPAIFLALGETTRAVSKRFQVMAPLGSDILPTISDWEPSEGASRTSN
jgi:peptide/nickel transport system substrate-binding protein